MLQKVINIGVNATKGRNFSVMLGKVMARLKEKDAQQRDVVAWCSKHAEPAQGFMTALDGKLWDEALSVCGGIKERADEKLQELGLDLGGGGNYPLLYFFVRFLKAKCVIETGVAAGWSSQAVLYALKDNGDGGWLYSSDFPYFRYKNPEELVGFIVDDSLKENWELHIEGDENNLPRILESAKQVDLFHYDSDKSYGGREFALAQVEPHLSDSALIIFDDIQDNAHFKDLVEARGCAFKVFEFEGKYVGVFGSLLEKDGLKA